MPDAGGGGGEWGEEGSPLPRQELRFSPSVSPSSSPLSLLTQAQQAARYDAGEDSDVPMEADAGPA
eukprot:2275962-Prymnesium_polylepis.1